MSLLEALMHCSRMGHCAGSWWWSNQVKGYVKRLQVSVVRGSNFVGLFLRTLSFSCRDSHSAVMSLNLEFQHPSLHSTKSQAHGTSWKIESLFMACNNERPAHFRIYTLSCLVAPLAHGLPTRLFMPITQCGVLTLRYHGVHLAGIGQERREGRDNYRRMYFLQLCTVQYHVQYKYIVQVQSFRCIWVWRGLRLNEWLECIVYPSTTDTQTYILINSWLSSASFFPM